MKVLSITENGYGKLTEIDEYRVQSRGGKGIKAMNLTQKTGKLTCQLLADEAEDILLITDDGTIIRTPVSSISTLGRNTQGVRLMRVAEESKVVCVARAEAEEDEPDDAENDIAGADSLDMDPASPDSFAPDSFADNPGDTSLDRLIERAGEDDQGDDEI